MEQHFDKYSNDDHAVWKVLFERQVENLSDKACPEFNQCLDTLRPVMHGRSIPDFRMLDAALLDTTGWQIEVVPGHIPVIEFFELLSRRRFPASTWLRTMKQLDYLEEPDMFHDIFGHIPLLIHPEYAEFMYEFGRSGVQWRENDAMVQALRSLYWFTIEFGLLQDDDQRSIYGAGILSSFGESIQVFDQDTPVLPFDLREILNTEFRTDVMQNQYFACRDLEQFISCLPRVNQLFENAQARARLR